MLSDAGFKKEIPLLLLLRIYSSDGEVMLLKKLEDLRKSKGPAQKYFFGDGPGKEMIDPG